MSILSDRQIKKLCTPPSFVITELIPQKQDPQLGAYILPKESTSFTYMTREEIVQKTHTRNTDIGITNYRKLTEEEIAKFKPMISPFCNQQVRYEGGNLCSPPPDAPEPDFGEMVSYRTPIKKVISYGLSSYGYDVRLDRKFKIFTNINSALIDPLSIDDKCFVDHEGDYCIIPPNSYALGVTMEYFKIPRDVTAICVGKSTYARCGALINVTPIEAGFEGNVVIEICNGTTLPLKVYAGMGISQFTFYKGEECEVSYADRGGKYQGQVGLTMARV